MIVRLPQAVGAARPLAMAAMAADETTHPMQTGAVEPWGMGMFYQSMRSIRSQNRVVASVSQMTDKAAAAIGVYRPLPFISPRFEGGRITGAEP